jgi:hypothetical protein
VESVQTTDDYEDDDDYNQSIIRICYSLPRKLSYQTKEDLGWLNERWWDACVIHKARNEKRKEVSTRNDSKQVTSIRRCKIDKCCMKLQIELRISKWPLRFHIRGPSVDKMRNYKLEINTLLFGSRLWVIIWCARVMHWNKSAEVLMQGFFPNTK